MKSFKKIIIWGHKLTTPDKSHTHSFIHDAFYKAFKYLDYDVLWLDQGDNLDGYDFNNCLFLTEGQVSDKMPIINASKYILHNCDMKEYEEKLQPNNFINLQVFTNDCMKRDIDVIDDKQFAFYEPNIRTLYQPWATNLLPYEFSPQNNVALKFGRTKKIYWVGSVMFGEFRNDDKLTELKIAAKRDGVELLHAKLPNKIQQMAIAESWIAPALQGDWQINKGYIPCRVFKNLSFGRMTPTNSETVNNLLDNKLVYSSNVEEMYNMATLWELEPNRQVLNELINLVNEKHTYINRIQNILKVL